MYGLVEVSAADFESHERGRRRGASLLAWVLVLVGQLASASPALADQPRTGQLLWQITSSEGSSWLLGSIHFGRADMYPLPSAIERAYDASAALAVEVNITAVDPAQALQTFNAVGTYRDGSTLRDHLSSATWEHLERLVSRYDVPAAMFAEQKPWLAALTLTTMELARAGLSEEYGVDRYFLRRAHEHKPVVELETFDGQLELFGQLSPGEQEQFLRGTLRDLDEGEKLFTDTVEAWRAGDATAIDTLMNRSFRSVAEGGHLYRVLLADRNRAMTARIERLLQAGKSYFIVVGAAHLVGKDGIVARLRADGYRVQRR